ncbi:unnamed protein product [Paramecium pentaurelia]|uniref:EF-hand domain-containing protein n=1 Tax=Paramecium pentaurelia TaxID=43138 RepID=A0A8S1UCZ9_9CILI|nr:unnamed protein product [Paramecium pentaurelia]
MINLQAIVSLDIGEKIEQICIYEGDDIELLTQFFCDRHHIKQEGKQFIIAEIKRQLKVPVKTRHTSILSLNTQQLVQKLYRNKTEMDVFEQLYADASNQQKRLNTALQEQDQEQKQINYAIPRINSISRLIVKKRGTSEQPIHSKLYNDAKLLDAKKQILRQRVMSQIYPFHPNNGITFAKKPTLQEQIQHAEKLIQEKRDQKLKLQQRRLAQESAQNDKITNQAYFKPLIRKDQTFKLVKKKIDKQDEILSNLIDNKLIKLNDKNNTKSIMKEREVANNINFVEKIFKQLDSDRDGLISIQYINLNINEKVLKKINPILNYIEGKKQEINLDYFFQLLKLFHIKLD